MNIKGNETHNISWEVVIISEEQKETNPVVLEAIAKGLEAQSIPVENKELCAYASCNEKGVVVIENLPFCENHAKSFIRNLLDNPQNKE